MISCTPNGPTVHSLTNAGRTDCTTDHVPLLTYLQETMTHGDLDRDGNAGAGLAGRCRRSDHLLVVYLLLTDRMLTSLMGSLAV